MYTAKYKSDGYSQTVEWELYKDKRCIDSGRTITIWGAQLEVRRSIKKLKKLDKLNERELRKQSK